MRIRLLHPDQDAEWSWTLAASGLHPASEAGRPVHNRPVSEWSALPRNARELIDDLELEILLEAMAGGDDCIHLIARHELLNAGRNGRETIAHRRTILRTILAKPDLFRALYSTVIGALRDGERPHLDHGTGDHPERVVSSAAQVLMALVPHVSRLAEIAENAETMGEAPSLERFFAMLRRELTPKVLESMSASIATLRATGGDVMSASLGPGNKGMDYVPHRPLAASRSGWSHWIHGRGSASPRSYSFSVSPVDEVAQTALRQLRNRGLAETAKAAGQSAMHVRSFLGALRVELAFYIGCLNLHEKLDAKGEPTCFPVPLPPASAVLFCGGLYDPCLSLARTERIIGNDVRAAPSRLILVTGANEGGKSTFLRSVGVAQLMLQAGMFVPAKTFASGLTTGLFTHFRREEDRWMRHGKLEEELTRLSDIVEGAAPGAILLLNESLASTYEQEGSAIACQMVRALAEAGVRTLFVTHLHEFARRAGEAVPDISFLRAERDEEGRRTFRITPGEPLRTAFAEDLYAQVFGEPLPAFDGALA